MSASIKQVLLALVALGELAECQGTDGSSPVSNLVSAINRYGIDMLANLNPGVNGSRASLNGKQLILSAKRGVLNGEPPLSIKVEGADVDTYSEFVIRANALLAEAGF